MEILLLAEASVLGIGLMIIIWAKGTQREFELYKFLVIFLLFAGAYYWVLNLIVSSDHSNKSGAEALAVGLGALALAVFLQGILAIVRYVRRRNRPVTATVRNHPPTADTN